MLPGSIAVVEADVVVTAAVVVVGSFLVGAALLAELLHAASRTHSTGTMITVGRTIGECTSALVRRSVNIER
jgi:hypothetical protein